MPQHIDLDNLADPAEAVRQTVACLMEGGVVLLPDEVGSLLLALPDSNSAVDQLHVISEHIPGATRLVAIAHPSVIYDYEAEVSSISEKLARRCWPGPVALRTPGKSAESQCETWPDRSKQWGINDLGRAFMVPGGVFAEEVVRKLPTAALGLSVSPEQVKEISTDQIDLVVSSSAETYSEGITVVSVQDHQLRIEREGVVSKRVLNRLTGEVYIFICTGNTCRSPMAEAIFRKMLADKIGCQDDELLDRGYTVISAGLAAYPGAPASRDAVLLLREDGIDLSSHESQPVTQELLRHCDQIFTMTRSHLDAILNSLPELAGKVHLLSGNGNDVSDPIGGGPDEYRRCRDEIEGYLQKLLDQQEI